MFCAISGLYFGKIDVSVFVSPLYKLAKASKLSTHIAA